MITLELFLIALLLFFVTATVGYNMDGGLKATHYCIEHGETEQCFKEMSKAN